MKKNSKRNKHYDYSDLKGVLEMMDRGVSPKAMSRQLGRSVHSARRLLYLFRKALKLDKKERTAFFKEQRVAVSLFNKVVLDHLSGCSTASKVEVEVEPERESDGLLELEEKLSQARQVFEEAVVDYALEASKEIYKEQVARIINKKTKEIKDGYKGQITVLQNKISELEQVKEAAQKSNLSYNIRRKLLGYK